MKVVKRLFARARHGRMHRPALALWALWVLLVVALKVHEASAQAPQEVAPQEAAPEEDAASSRSAAFQAVEGPSAEQVPGGPLLIGAYGVILVLLIGYVARLGSLHAKNELELERLARALEAGRKG